MNECILNLAPKGIWEEFHGILGVPRPSRSQNGGLLGKMG